MVQLKSKEPAWKYTQIRGNTCGMKLLETACKVRLANEIENGNRCDAYKWPTAQQARFSDEWILIRLCWCKTANEIHTECLISDS